MYLTWLADAARRTGYPVVESAGWLTRGHGPMSMCEGVVGHHTATSAKAGGDYPSLGIVRDGRSNLKGPLSHLGLGRNGTVYVIAAGNCWHAGVSVWAGFTNLNDKFIGIEAENPGDGSWTTAQLDAYPKLVGALLFAMKRGPGRYASHRSVAIPAGRKPDPAGLTDEWMRTHAVRFMEALAGPSAPVTPSGAASAGELPTLREGDRNDDVMALHRWLTRMYPSYASFTPTGFYGPLTVDAVAEFQRRTGVTGPDADGTIIGPRTNRALWAEGYRGL
jgi:N-acetylmuramoyl-L-alanine amidase/Putative peptidoglycan binding domain